MPVVNNPSGSAIDVASIVSSLMESKRAPLQRVERRITQGELAISGFAMLRSKSEALRQATLALEHPRTFATKTTTSSNSTVATVTASPLASVGNYSLTVDTLAKPNQIKISGFTSATQSVSFDSAFDFKVGDYWVGTDPYPSDPPSPNLTFTDFAGLGIENLSKFRDWINSLSADVSADIVKVSSTNYTLVISAADPTLSLTGFGVTNELGTGFQKAKFQLNGVSLERNSNLISDVISGLKFDLKSKGDTSVDVLSNGEESARTALKSFADAYNDLMTFYKTSLTPSKTDSQSQSGEQLQSGSLLGNSSAAIFIDQIRRFSSGGVRLLGREGANASTSLGRLGLELRYDGFVTFNESEFQRALSRGLLDDLVDGIKIGTQSENGGLSSFLASAVVSKTGFLEVSLGQTANSLESLRKERLRINDNLAKVQQQLTIQYANLDSQLLKLRGLSTSMSSMFDGLMRGSNR